MESFFLNTNGAAARLPLVLLVSSLVLAGCGGKKPATAPEGGKMKATQRPYTVLGKRYEPLPTHEGFTQEGVASWYGKDFHGKKTSNGEIYDMHAMTAAHKTLMVTHYQWPDIARHSFPTISMTTDFVAAVPMGAWVEGIAEVIRATRSMVFIQGTAMVDEETVLRFSGIYKIGPKRDYANPRDPFGLMSTPATGRK